MDDQIGEPGTVQALPRRLPPLYFCNIWSGIVEALPRAAVVKVLCGNLHTAAVTRAGQVFTWGSGESGALGHGGFHQRAAG